MRSDLLVLAYRDKRAAEQRHLPASTLARSLLRDKLGEQYAPLTRKPRTADRPG